MNLKKLLLFARNIKTVYKLFFDWLDQARTNEAVDAKIRELGFTDGRHKDHGGILGSPICDPGTAVKLMTHYNIKLSIGTSYGNCRANLSRQYWQHPIDPNKKPGEFGAFFADTPHDEIDDIYGFGRTVNEAICRCLINCKTAGVL